MPHQSKQAACPPVHVWLNDGFDHVWEGRKMKSVSWIQKNSCLKSFALSKICCYRFSSSTEQSSTRLMRRHRRRRRKPKASNMDRVRPQTANQQHKRSSSYLNISLFFTFLSQYSRIISSLHRSAALQTPPCLWTSSLSLSTWVSNPNTRQLLFRVIS